MSHSAPAGSSVGASTNAGPASGGSITTGASGGSTTTRASGAAAPSGLPGGAELPLLHPATITTTNATNAIRIGRTLPDAFAAPSLDGSRAQFVTRVLRRIVRRGQREGERAGVARSVGAA